MKILMALYKKNRIVMKRAYPFSYIIQRLIAILFGMIFPLMLYFFAFNGNTSNKFNMLEGNISYPTFIVLGFLSFSIFFSTLMSIGKAMVTEYEEGTLIIVYKSHISLTKYFASVYMEQFVRSMIEALILMLGSIGLKILSISIVLNWSFLFSIIVISFSSFCMSVLVAYIIYFSKSSYLVQNTVSMLVSLVSGISFPVDMLPSKLRVISSFLPISYGVDLIRTKNITTRYFQTAAMAVGTGMIYLMIGIIFFNKSKDKIIGEL